MCPRAPKPFLLSLETLNTWNNKDNCHMLCAKYDLYKYPNFGNSFCWKWSKIMVTEKSLRSVEQWKSWIWDQYLSKSMKSKFGNMGSLKLWEQEISKPKTQTSINQGAENPINQKTKAKKPRNQTSKHQETKKLFFQARKSPIPLNIPTPTAPDHLLGGHERTNSRTTWRGN